MSEQHWVLLDAAGHIIAQPILAEGEEPTPANCSIAFATAEMVDRQGDLVIEQLDGMGGWQPDLAVLRVRRWLAVKARRAIAEAAGCDTPLGRADTDSDSQRKLSGAVQMAMIAQAADEPFVVGWTMQDNETVEHDAAAMITLGVLAGQHVAACHAVAVAKRADIEAAEDAAAIAAVDIEAGWPG